MADYIDREELINRLKEDMQKCETALNNNENSLDEDALKWAMWYDDIMIDVVEGMPVIEQTDEYHRGYCDGLYDAYNEHGHCKDCIHGEYLKILKGYEEQCKKMPISCRYWNTRATAEDGYCYKFRAKTEEVTE